MKMSRKPRGFSSHHRFCLTSTHVALPLFHFGIKHEHQQKYKTTTTNMNHSNQATVVLHTLIQTTEIELQGTSCFSFTHRGNRQKLQLWSKQNKIYSVKCARNIKQIKSKSVHQMLCRFFIFFLLTLQILYPHSRLQGETLKMY